MLQAKTHGMLRSLDSESIHFLTTIKNTPGFSSNKLNTAYVKTLEYLHFSQLVYT